MPKTTIAEPDTHFSHTYDSGGCVGASDNIVVTDAQDAGDAARTLAGPEISILAS